MSLLSLVRWYNIVLVASAQYLASIFILNSGEQWYDTLLDARLFALAVSSALLIAAGYIINGFYDSEKDLINRPDVALFNQLVSKKFRLYCYFGFNAAGVFIALIAGFRVALFHMLFSAGLWLYSHKLKKVLFLGNFSGTLLSIVPFFSVCLYYRMLSPFIALYVGFVFLIELTREIVKDMLAVKGDTIMGYKTLPVAFGLFRTRIIVLLLQCITVSIPFFLYMLKGTSPVMYYFLFSALLITVAMISILLSDKASTFSRVNTIYKVILLSGIICISLF